jgi:DNA-binding transcriptional LysR family regulator
MSRENLSDLAAFVEVARTGSFTRAAQHLRVSQPALSHALKELEKRLGLRLLNRTTRSVSTTEAGERLLRSIAPHFEGIEASLSDLKELLEKPAGTIRITVGDEPAEAILLPVAAQLMVQHPDINIELSVNNGFVDIVAERFDAGVRLGETLAQDMVAVPISPRMRMAIVGSPAYFANRPPPRTPQDLTAHNCINLKHTIHGGVSVWDLSRKGRAVNVRVDGQFTVNDIALMRAAAVRGVGLAYLPESYLGPHIESGELTRVLADWCEPFAGYYFYYPSRRQPSAAFTILVEALRHRA